MDICKLIIEKIYKKGEVKASEIMSATGFSRPYVNRFFRQLRDEGQIILLGKANRARYILADKKALLLARKKISHVSTILSNKDLYEDKVLNKVKNSTGIFFGISKNISDILDYAFLEMLNNAIEHSNSKQIHIEMKKTEHSVWFSITDQGVGIYNNIQKKKRLNNAMEAIQDLLKGKQTTAPEAHSGEGIFFTSKTADIFTIQSSRKKLIYDNLLDDIFIRDIKYKKGTKVTFAVNLESKKLLANIFKKYTDDSFEFSRTEVTVRLYKMGSEYISRSQARRVLSGLDKFKKITLDFKGVRIAGQGFVDEIFRVWKIKHPDTVIITKNANKNIMFMIRRVLPEELNK